MGPENGSVNIRRRHICLSLISTEEERIKSDGEGTSLTKCSGTATISKSNMRVGVASVAERGGIKLLAGAFLSLVLFSITQTFLPFAVSCFASDFKVWG